MWMLTFLPKYREYMRTGENFNEEDGMFFM